MLQTYFVFSKPNLIRSILYWSIAILIPFVNSAVFNLPGSRNSDSYGPYKVYVKFFESCLKSDDSNTSITYENGKYMATFILSVPETVRVDDVRALIQTVKNNVKSTLLDYTIQNPCRQGSPLVRGFRKFLGAQNCVLKKGKYDMKVNFSEEFDRFSGNSFFYGEFIFKIEFMSKKRIILCFKFDEVFSKK